MFARVYEETFVGVVCRKSEDGLKELRTSVTLLFGGYKASSVVVKYGSELLDNIMTVLYATLISHQRE